MHFSKKLLAAIQAALPEWSLFFVDYKQLKKIAKAVSAGALAASAFWECLEEEKARVLRFYRDKEAWATAFLANLVTRVDRLSSLGEETGFHREDVAEYVHALVAKARGESDDDFDGDDEDDADDDASSGDGPGSPPRGAARASASSAGAGEAAPSAAAPVEPSSAGAGPSGGATTAAAQQAGASLEKRRAEYVAVKKGLSDFRRELTLLERYVELNGEALRKIVKKFSKLAGTDEQRDAYMSALEADEAFAFLRGEALAGMVARVDELLAAAAELKPQNSKWDRTKVFTVGCFDLAHRGHANLFRALREYGRYVVVGLHDDASYFRLKRKRTVDDLETRIANIKPFCDAVFVIPSTDPTPFLQAMVSDQDVRDGVCCYVRGADMPSFPGREFVESVMPVHLLPRSDGVSSSLVRAIFHSGEDEDADLVQARALAAAFAPLDSAGKPLVTDDMVDAELRKIGRKRELAEVAKASKERALGLADTDTKASE